MNNSQDHEIKYRLLKILSQDSDITQRHMAREMGISLGKVNTAFPSWPSRGL